MKKTAWIITDGKKGTENQCLGVTALLGLSPLIKTIRPRFPWSILPPSLWFFSLKGIEGLASKELQDLPDIVVGGGRSAAPVVRAIKKKTFGKTKTIFVQNPYLPLKNFDWVIAPSHDHLQGENVIETLGCVHSITPRRLEEAFVEYQEVFGKKGLKNVAILIGGKTRHYTMTPSQMESYGRQFKALAQTLPLYYLITASRRTDPLCLEAFKKGLGEAPYFLWDGTGKNPYLGFLAHADTLLVTGDSVSMISEAIATRKPVYILSLEGHSKKLDFFHQELTRRGIARFFEGTFDRWSYNLPDFSKLLEKVKNFCEAV